MRGLRRRLGERGGGLGTGRVARSSFCRGRWHPHKGIVNYGALADQGRIGQIGNLDGTERLVIERAAGLSEHTRSGVGIVGTTL